MFFFQTLAEDNMNDVSIMSFTPTVEDDGKYLTCRAENPYIENSALEDKWHLNVHCKYAINIDKRLCGMRTIDSGCHFFGCATAVRPLNRA